MKNSNKCTNSRGVKKLPFHEPRQHKMCLWKFWLNILLDRKDAIFHYIWCEELGTWSPEKLEWLKHYQHSIWNNFVVVSVIVVKMVKKTCFLWFPTLMSSQSLQFGSVLNISTHKMSFYRLANCVLEVITFMAIAISVLFGKKSSSSILVSITLYYRNSVATGHGYIQFNFVVMNIK